MGLISIDFDHTICDNFNKPDGERYPHPFPGARDAISTFREKGHRVMIFSCNGTEWIEEWMKHWDIRYDYIWEGTKPNYDLLIDDKCLHFYGDWSSTLVTTFDRLK